MAGINIKSVDTLKNAHDQAHQRINSDHERANVRVLCRQDSVCHDGNYLVVDDGAATTRPESRGQRAVSFTQVHEGGKIDGERPRELSGGAFRIAVGPVGMLARARPEILADVKEGQSHAGEMTEGQSTGDLDKCSVSTVGVGERNVHKPQQKRT